MDFRRSSRAPRGAALLFILGAALLSGALGRAAAPDAGMTALGWAAAAAPAEARRPPRVVLEAGALYLWDRAAPSLAALPAGLLPGDAPPLGVVDPDDGRGVIVLRGTAETGGQARDRHEGEALLLAWSPAARDAQGLALAWTARFEGLPRAAAAAAGRAWILARRADDDAPGAGRLRIHEIDRTSGRVEDHASLSGAAAAIAADPLGRRVYVALEDRILSLTTRPLVVSWHHRSPGSNGALAVSPSGTLLAVARGREVALFDAAAVSARAAAGPSDRSDDATSVVPLPFSPDELTFSRDGSLLAAFGAGGLAFIAPATGMVLWPETTAPLQGAAELRPLAFPGAGGDLIVAAFPAGVVSALPPPVIAGATPSGTASANAAPGGDAEAAKGVADDVPATVGPSAAMALDPRTPEATSKEEAAAAPTSSEGPPAAPAPDAAPVLVTAPAPAPGTAATPPAPAAAPVSPPAPATAPAPSTARPDEDSRATLSGAIHGDRARARAIVLYGPSSIVREFARATPDAGGEWRLALPPPGVYRIVVIGDGSTPIPVAPAFITVTLTEGTSQAGLDFTVGRSP